jgi:hypothetical protein
MRFLALLLLLGACSQRAAEERCQEAQRLYDADRNVTAGGLTFVACIR